MKMILSYGWDNITEGNRTTGRYTAVIFSATNLTLTVTESNPGLRGDSLATRHGRSLPHPVHTAELNMLQRYDINFVLVPVGKSRRVKA